MITVSDLGLAYSGQPLFSHVDLQFTKGNCYGIIGANGAGKSTFLKILSGELEPTSGEVSILPKTRMSVLKQDQNAYNAYNVMDTVIMGNQRLYDIGKEKEALYAKEEMTEADGIRACELEEEYAELGGWEAESDASRILQGLGVGTEFHSNDMATLDARLKVKVLLAQALFGELGPDSGREVAVSAGPVRHDELDGFDRITARGCRGRQSGRQKSAQNAQGRSQSLEHSGLQD